MSDLKYRVAKVIDEETFILNKGKADGINPGDRFLVYAQGDEIFDPETKESLGQLELIRGTGKVIHVQDRIATVKSDMKTSPVRTIRKPNIGGLRGLSSLAASLSASYELEEYLPPTTVPFENLSEGDFVRPT